jgi:UDP-N-acetylmuramoyl-L-alanyl-D-glutamate--2,6-diaminopimelate ligase
MKLADLAGPGYPLDDDAGDVEITGLTADSREVEPGFLFAGLPGTRMDGADFIPQALRQGATALLLPGNSPAAAGAAPVPVITVADPRRALALMAARFHAAQPETIAAVTGTNGKTSVVSFVRQIWQGLGRSAASLGTVGAVTPSGPRDLLHTTPDPVALHRTLAGLAGEGITHLALEASSHGLQQRRLDGVAITAAAFTNISHDHLDYHASFEAYLAQKLYLFETLLPEGAPVVVDADAGHSEAVLAVARRRALPVISVGRAGETLTLTGAEREDFAQRLRIAADGRTHEVLLPLAGDFQSANALVAAGLCIACGERAEDVIPLLGTLTGARGRLERAGSTAAGAPVFVDYAHTPDALANALDALRPYVTGRLHVVFGCGGDRDRGKRPEMGRIAAERADVVYVTDDNPRGEDPAAIRAEILAAATGAVEAGDRRAAIGAAIAALGPGDLLLVAGKGHETGQIIGDTVVPFSDHAVVAEFLEEGDSDG